MIYSQNKSLCFVLYAKSLDLSTFLQLVLIISSFNDRHFYVYNIIIIQLYTNMHKINIKNFYTIL